VTRLLTLSYEIASKNELYLFLSEPNYFMVKPNRRSEDNKYLPMAGLLYGQVILVVILEIVSFRKFRFAKVFFLETFKMGFVLGTIMVCAFLPKHFDKLLALSQLAPATTRLQTYSQESFRQVALLEQAMTLFYAAVLSVLAGSFMFYASVARLFLGSHGLYSEEEKREARLFRAALFKMVFGRLR